MNWYILILTFVLFSCRSDNKDSSYENDLRKVEGLIEQGYLGRALKLTDELIKNYPKDQGSFYLKAVVLDSLGRDQEAIEYYYKTIKLNDTHLNARYSMARLLEKSGQLIPAYREYRFIMMVRGYGNLVLQSEFDNLPPEDEMMPIGEVAYRKLLIDDKLNYYDQVIIDSELCISENFRKPESYYLKGKALIYLGYDSLGCIEINNSKNLGYVVSEMDRNGRVMKSCR